MKNSIILVLLFLVTACSNHFQIDSQSLNFMGEELDKPISSDAKLTYDEDKGCYANLKDGGRVDCELKSKKVLKITAQCNQTSKKIALDGYECGRIISEKNIDGYNKLCNDSTFDDGYILSKSKGFMYIKLDSYTKEGKVASIGIVNEIKNLRDEGEDSYSNDKCTNIPINRAKEKAEKEAKLKASMLEKYGKKGAFCFDEGAEVIDISAMVLGDISVDKYAMTLRGKKGCFSGILESRTTDRESLTLASPTQDVTTLYFENSRVVCIQFNEYLRQEAVELGRGAYFVSGQFKEVFAFSSGRSSIYLTNCKIVNSRIL